MAPNAEDSPNDDTAKNNSSDGGNNSGNNSNNEGGGSDNSGLVSIGGMFGFNFDNDDSDPGPSSQTPSEGETATAAAARTAEQAVAGLGSIIKSFATPLPTEDDDTAAAPQQQEGAEQQQQQIEALGSAIFANSSAAADQRKRKAEEETDAGSEAGYKSDNESGENGGPDSGENQGAKPTRKKKKLDNRKREERNQREKERSFRISKQITDLRNLLSNGGIVVPKGTKSSVLTEAANYIRMLQQHQYRSEMYVPSSTRCWSMDTHSVFASPVTVTSSFNKCKSLEVVPMVPKQPKPFVTLQLKMVSGPLVTLVVSLRRAPWVFTRKPRRMQPPVVMLLLLHLLRRRIRTFLRKTKSSRPNTDSSSTHVVWAWPWHLWAEPSLTVTNCFAS